MFRKYTISIISKDDAPEIADNVLKEFGCSVSEPSNWLTPGLTTERGLTFITKRGKELDSFIFRHQPYFNPETDRKVPEEKEIEALIYSALFEYYQLEKSEIKVMVSESGN